MRRILDDPRLRPGDAAVHILQMALGPFIVL